ncbi:MAG: ammonium transporter, partial [Acidobacteria bacterium]
MRQRLFAIGGFMVLFPGLLAAQDAAAPTVDTGDTAFVLVSAALVMLMTPGLAFFYG